MDKKKVFTGILLTGLLASCTNQALLKNEGLSSDNTGTNFHNEGLEKDESYLLDDKKVEVKNTSSDIKLKELTIDHKCIGCTRCAKFTPSHFAMSGRVAVVTNQEDIGSAAVADAIASCPVDAISIE